VPNRKPSTSHCEPLLTCRVTRANAKAVQDGARTVGGVEEEDSQKTESEEERPASPLHQVCAKVHILLSPYL
jgi:hypothetical protein